MSCVRPAFLFLFATSLVRVAVAADAAPTQSNATETAPTVEAASAPVPPPSRARAISPTAAAQLAAAGPKFDPVAATKPVEVSPDLRETDKPRNTIIRLPAYVVQDAKPPVFKERDLLTPQARLKLAMAKHPGLHLGSLGIFSNDSVALMMLAEEERLEQKREFEDFASMMRYSDPATRATVKREVERAFMREPQFGR